MTTMPAYSAGFTFATLFSLAAAVSLLPVLFNGCSGAKQETNGLTGKYYHNAKWEGEPADVHVDPTIDFDWSEKAPYEGPFSADWTGTIVIDQAGDYQFGLVSDDGSILEIDGRVVVDASNVLLQKQTGTVQLSQGAHSIHLKYFNTMLGGSVRLFWAPPGQTDHIVPANVLRSAAN